MDLKVGPSRDSKDKHLSHLKFHCEMKEAVIEVKEIVHSLGREIVLKVEKRVIFREYYQIWKHLPGPNLGAGEKE